MMILTTHQGITINQDQKIIPAAMISNQEIRSPMQAKIIPLIKRYPAKVNSKPFGMGIKVKYLCIPNIIVVNISKMPSINIILLCLGQGPGRARSRTWMPKRLGYLKVFETDAPPLCNLGILVLRKRC